MKSLLIVAHGSRREVSNQEVLDLASRVAQQPGHDFDYVAAAFLEIAEPSIPDGLERCVQLGASEVVIFPYFLAAGRHVVDDIPDEAAKIASKYPNVKFTITGYLGISAEIPQIIINSVKS
jgi:sirohydrochlorin ferrochelatase